MYSKIEEISHFREALGAIQYNTVLVLDLDNTAMTPMRSLGGDAWFEGLFVVSKNSGLAPEIAHPALFSVYNRVQHFVRTKPVEPSIVTIINTLQDIGIPVIGLTARGKEIREATLRQLQDIGIDFSKGSLISDDEICLGGVVFCSGGNKGEYLKLALQKMRYKPGHVTMLDDKKKHLECVKLVLDELNIPFHGFRYAHLDEEVQQFNMEEANKELSYLWNELSSPVRRDVTSLGLLKQTHFSQANTANHLSQAFFSQEQRLCAFKSTPEPMQVEANLNFFHAKRKRDIEQDLIHAAKRYCEAISDYKNESSFPNLI